MPQESQSEQDPDDSDTEFVEIDPTGRYGRVSFLSVFLCNSDHAHQFLYCF